MPPHWRRTPLPLYVGASDWITQHSACCIHVLIYALLPVPNGDASGTEQSLCATSISFSPTDDMFGPKVLFYFIFCSKLMLQMQWLLTTGGGKGKRNLNGTIWACRWPEVLVKPNQNPTNKNSKYLKKLYIKLYKNIIQARRKGKCSLCH